MFKKSINNKTNSVLESLSPDTVKNDFYLAGGTALALQFGHRQSIDLNFFSAKNALSKIT